MAGKGSEIIPLGWAAMWMGKGWGENKFGYLVHSYPIQLLSKVEYH
jgi:hypothetical protein